MVQISAILAFIACFLLFETSAAGRCGVSAPQVTLSELHSGCSSDSKSRTPECVAAMHRFCGQVTYPTAITTLGVSREHANGRIGMSCIRSRWSGNVPITTLQSHHSGCNAAKSQHRDCLAAIHRYCRATLGGTQFAGTSQEVPSTSAALYVKCFETPHEEHVRHDVLAAHHSGCTFPNSDSGACYAAASRWCVLLGYSGGISQEVNTNGVTVACYNAEFTNDAFVSRISDYYVANRRVVHICRFNFDVNRGILASQTSQMLKRETYNNRASSIPLHGKFQVSKQVIETSSFTHNHTFTIGTEISARFPFLDDSNSIVLHGSATSGVSLTRKTRKIRFYKFESPVEVHAGGKIVRKATVQIATLSVPWNAVIINSLGVATPVGGQWIGENTFNFQVKQEDIDGKFPCAVHAPKVNTTVSAA